MKKIIVLVLIGLTLTISAYADDGGWVDMGGFCWRKEVPHGWLVRTKFGYGEGLCFYPDENHEWRK